MRGDVIIVEEHHRRAAATIVDALLPEIEASARRFTVTVAGESGSGKSETAQALAEALGARGVRAGVLQQDDYFVHPPKTNDATRRQDISWVGVGEVKLALLDDHLRAAREGAEEVTKPLVIYEEDRVTEETMSYRGLAVVIAEGTYTSLLEKVDRRVFIARNRLETMAARQQRAREQMDPFIERVLELEHAIIAPHRDRADDVISRDYAGELWASATQLLAEELLVELPAGHAVEALSHARLPDRQQVDGALGRRQGEGVLDHVPEAPHGADVDPHHVGASQPATIVQAGVRAAQRRRQRARV